VSEPVIRYDKARVVSARSGEQGFPSLISPRGTDVLDAKPLIRWSAIGGVDNYRVSVKGRDLDWTSDSVNGTELTYPTSAPPLKAEVDYQITIVGGGRSSSEEGAAGTGFRLAGESRVQEIRLLNKRIDDLKLGAVPGGLLRARAYADRRLHEDALRRLEVAALGSNSLALALAGDLYVRMQQWKPAMEAYRRAIDAAKASGDKEGIGHAGAMLGHLLLLANNKPDATQHLRDSVNVYTELGDKQALDDLARLLRAAERRG
jgi:tetratricopeptide (TPR) repeat protein